MLFWGNFGEKYTDSKFTFPPTAVEKSVDNVKNSPIFDGFSGLNQGKTHFFPSFQPFFRYKRFRFLYGGGNFVRRKIVRQISYNSREVNHQIERSMASLELPQSASSPVLR